MWEDFAQLAAQYYVSARFAARAGYVPLCGNLMHHAIELQLKCGLLKAKAIPTAEDARWTVRIHRAAQSFFSRRGIGSPPPTSVDEYMRKRYRHSLPRLWKAFQTCHPVQFPPQLHALIKTLEPWEEIRYPRRGITMSVMARSPQTSLPKPSGPAMRGVRQYSLIIEHADLFMQHTWSLIGISPEFFGMATHSSSIPVVTSVYSDDNIHMIYQ